MIQVVPDHNLFMKVEDRYSSFLYPSRIAQLHFWTPYTMSRMNSSCWRNFILSVCRKIVLHVMFIGWIFKSATYKIDFFSSSSKHIDFLIVVHSQGKFEYYFEHSSLSSFLSDSWQPSVYFNCCSLQNLSFLNTLKQTHQ